MHAGEGEAPLAAATPNAPIPSSCKPSSPQGGCNLPFPFSPPHVRSPLAHTKTHPQTLLLGAWELRPPHTHGGVPTCRSGVQSQCCPRLTTSLQAQDQTQGQRRVDSRHPTNTSSNAYLCVGEGEGRAPGATKHLQSTRTRHRAGKMEQWRRSPLQSQGKGLHVDVRYPDYKKSPSNHSAVMQGVTPAGAC